MSPATLLALLGVTLTLPLPPALTCQHLTQDAVHPATSLPLYWKAASKLCEDGWGCQDTLILIHNGPQVTVVLTKGCTLAEDQEAHITQHRSGPGLSVISYTHVCRQKDLCNNLTDSLALWTLTSAVAPAPRGVQCPTCLSKDGCQEIGTELPCPTGLTHCYKGVLTLNGGGITTKLSVQGCMAQEGCSLLHGTQKIGSISVSENCNPEDDLMCHSGTMLKVHSNLSQEPTEWTAAGNQTCNAGEICRETLLLIDPGHKQLLVGRKDCASPGVLDSDIISTHLTPPGMLVVSYASVCSSNWCNSANSSSVLLNNTLPQPGIPALGDRKCPVCVEVFGSCSNSKLMTCPVGTTDCYNGYISVSGGEVSIKMHVQGCRTQGSKDSWSISPSIGAFYVNGNFKDQFPQQNEVSPAPYLAWVVGLELFLALLCGGFCLPYSPHFQGFLASADPPQLTS
ncbi:LOW QUALITY PROTEIN: CD177 antigen [Orycteropus afer afer]|uniref:LOW QUALITY PROTEIN: CD177 antigen n=1 Tax=Orycteropus afer afer TaxID=1230840 RepID=A0AC54ZB99_ORYAF|nr:LOW QUALITY PROTEIN: CD177 antigen [Orycteropus afer afer]